MSMNGNGGSIPSWLQLALGAFVAAISGIIGMVTVAWRVSEKLRMIQDDFRDQLKVVQDDLRDQMMALRIHIDVSDSKRFHDLIGVIQGESGKSERVDETLGERIGALEQDMAVMTDFKKRYEDK